MKYLTGLENKKIMKEQNPLIQKKKLFRSKSLHY